MPAPSGPSGWARRVGATAVQMGFDARKLSSLRMIPRFLSDRARFLAAGGRIDRHMPVLSDYADQAGAARGHYFHQDLLVATMIHRAAPRRHIDVGSRIDGFVAHVAAFRDIEVIDIRPLKIDHPRIAFLQHDILKLPQELRGAADSVSCLHALEHFGLGRYGDTIDPDAHLKGFSALGDLLEVGGTLYMGLPIGRSGVYFNAHRVFSPSDLLTWSKENFELNRFDYVDDAGDLHCEARVDNTPPLDYGCGIYTMTKIA